MKNKELILKKPSPFYAPGSEKPITDDEIKRRRERIDKAASIGLDITKLSPDDSDEYVNPYKMEALSYISANKEIPNDLLLKIHEFDKNHRK